jgi:hypothetical protein
MQDSNHIFFDELSIIFSEERLDGYLSHVKCNNSKTDALIAYSWNIELSQALYPALQILEITFRNSLHQALSTNFNTAHWFDLPFLHEREKKQIEQAAEYALQVEKEQRWLPKLAPQLPLPILVPLALGKPTTKYPWHWSVYRWIEFFYRHLTFLQ